MSRRPRRNHSPAFKAKVAAATPLSEYLFEHHAEGIDLGNPDGLARLSKLVLPAISRIPGEVFRELMRRKLAERIGMSADRLPGATPAPREVRQEDAPPPPPPRRRSDPMKLSDLSIRRPVLAIVILFSTIFTFSDFNIVYVLTHGGPINSTPLFATLTRQVGLESGRIGEGAAISLAMFPFLFLIVVVQLLYIRRVETR